MSAHEALDATEFRHALGSFTTGVTVVTTRGADADDVGLTANSFNSVSLDPPMVLWSLGKSALSMPHFQSAEYFAVHILAEEQQELSTRFATRGIDKFAGLDLLRGPADIPLLQGCAARFICKTAYQYEGGDHIIFVGEVLEFSHSERHPLLFHAGQYGQLSKSPASNTTDENNEFQDRSVGFLLRYCSHKLLSQLKHELTRYDLSIAQYYFLALISKSDHESCAELLKHAEQGDTPPSAAEIEDLMVKGLIHTVNDELQLTDTGSQLHIKLLAHYKASESTALRVLDYDVRQTLQIALSKVAAAFSE